MLRFGFLCLFLVGRSSSAFSESLAADWQTLQTPHFRFHYITPYHEWTLKAVTQAESVFDELAIHTRNTIHEPIDVLVMDPLNTANGSAFPLVGRPLIVLFTTPPTADSALSNFNDWSDILIKHELVHIFHLTRPHRQSWEAVLGRLHLLYGISLVPDVPVWASEGYATYMEGKLTGAGRPHSDWVTSVVRELARQGQLPAYDKIGANKWLGRSLNYLVGAAYYEWLAQRFGEDKFTAIWQRLTAAEERDFDQAFSGVFGENPDVLYQRFVAESTHAALTTEKLLPVDVSSSQLWQRFNGRTGEPSVSPDGKKITVLVREPEKPSVLKIFALDDNDKAYEDWQKKRDQIAKNDPDDVPAIRPVSLPRQSLAEFASRDGSEALNAQWLNNEELLFTMHRRDSHGDRHSDVFRWHSQTGALQRLTVNANLSRIAPSRDGRWAVAVRSQFGSSQLVKLDLQSLQLTDINEASLSVVYDQPSIHPDGQSLIYLKNSGDGWVLMQRDLRNQHESVLYRPENGRFFAYPTFSYDGRDVLFSAGDNGYVNIYALSLQDKAVRALTQSSALTFAATPITNSNDYLYLRFDARGNDLYRATLTAQTPIIKPRIEGWAAIQTPIPTPVKTTHANAFATQQHDYGFGPQQATALLGFNRDAGDTTYQIGIRGGDPVGRFDWLLAASQSQLGSHEGAVASLIWRGWPVTVSGTVFYHDIESRQQREDTASPSVQEHNQGWYFNTAWSRYFDTLKLDWQAFVLARNQSGTDDAQQRWWGTQLSAAVDRRVGQWSWRYYANSEWAFGNDNVGDKSSQALGAFVQFDKHGLGVDWSHTRLRHSDTSLIVGGDRDTVMADELNPLWITDPLLPYANQQGDEFERQKLFAVIDPNWPTLFYQRQRVDDINTDWQRAFGFEMQARAPSQLPLAELRGLHARFGFARVEHEDSLDNRFWLALDYQW